MKCAESALKTKTKPTSYPQPTTTPNHVCLHVQPAGCSYTRYVHTIIYRLQTVRFYGKEIDL